MIEIKDLTFRYPGQRETLFEDFNMRLEEGKIYGLLGKNGTGKSTLLYLLTGLLRPKKGKIVCDGMNSSERRPEMLREMFLVPEEFRLPSISLNDYMALMEPFYPRFSREVMSSCLDEFELEHDFDLGALSLGEAKKVFMSVALASGARYLLMDEPTNGLDIPAKSKFRKVVARQMGEGKTIVISTHQVHDVETLIDQVVILDRKKLLMNLTVQEITDRYVFQNQNDGNMEGVVYTETTLSGLSTMAVRREADHETQVSLELLFNAVTKGVVK